MKQKAIEEMKAIYQENQKASNSVECICPSCKTKFTKKSYQQIFCKTKAWTKCKDKYWNTVTPEKRNNKTRISPASFVYQANRAWRITDSSFHFKSQNELDKQDLEEMSLNEDSSWEWHWCTTTRCEFCLCLKCRCD